ncbi:MAG: DUF3536 domain-containing protein [Myxococcota bacterium]
MLGDCCETHGSRDRYLNVLADREHALDAFIAHEAPGLEGKTRRIECLRLLEMQRHAMMMFTSCGWFFDDLSGIETVQILRYAGRALQLAATLGAQGLEATFVERLAQAKSNVPEEGDGLAVWNRHVRPSIVSLLDVGAHYAISSLFETFAREANIYCYRVERSDHQNLRAGRASFAVGTARVIAQATGESLTMVYTALHLGDHNVTAGVVAGPETLDYAALTADSSAAFSRVAFPEVIRLIDRHFGSSTYSLVLISRRTKAYS